MASLHKKLGDTVTVRSGAGGPHLLRIVGVATMPAIGGSGVLHLEMGTGAVVSSSLIPAIERNPFNDPETGPQAYFIDVRPGVNPLAARRSLEEMTAPLTNAYNFGVVVQSVLRPAEIVDYRSMGTTPAILGASLGAAALAALGLTLLASVRRRRRDLAVLKILGFTRYQLSAMVAWQSNLAIAIGTIVGIPVGITLGRTLWDLFAREINAVPSPSCPRCPDSPDRARCFGTRQSRRRRSRPYCCPDSSGAALANRMNQSRSSRTGREEQSGRAVGYGNTKGSDGAEPRQFSYHEMNHHQATRERALAARCHERFRETDPSRSVFARDTK